MNAEKSPRPDAKLKRLPEERQQAIIDLLAQPGMSLRKAVAELRQDGVETSLRGLSDFRTWWGLQQQFKQDAATVDSVLEELKTTAPTLTDQQLDEIGQRTFGLLSIRNQDLEGFVTLRSAATNAAIERAKLQLRERAEQRQDKKLGLEIDKFQFDISKACLAKLPELRAIANNPALDQSGKVLEVRQLLFGELPPATESTE